MLDRISLDSVSCSATPEPGPEPGPESGPESGRGLTIRPYRCQHCQARFSARKSLLLHMRRHASLKPFVCAHCPRRFSMRSAQLMHERTHLSEAQAPFSCEECGRRFRFSKSLASHLREAHLGRPLKCAACDALFLTTGGLKQHEELRHGIVPPPPPPPTPAESESVASKSEARALFKQNTTCYVCDKDFPTHSAMLVHLRVHGAGSRFRCRQCPAHFSSWLSLRSHWRIHSRANIFKCKVCAMRFGARSSLINHLKQHDRAKGGNIVRCVRCLEAFDSRKALHAHAKTHHEERTEADPPPPPPPPPAAPRQSMGEPELVLERIKTDPKLRYCETCPAVFDKYWNYWNHRKNLCPGVTGKPVTVKVTGKSFRCSTCGMRFKTRKLLYWHSQRHLVKSEPNAESEQSPADETAAVAEATSTSASPQKTFRCGKCSQPFPDRRALHIHSKTHSGAMVVISVEDETLMHLDPSFLPEPAAPAEEDIPAPASAKKGKGSKNVFRCGQCGQSYRGRKLLWRHRKSCGVETKMAADEEMSAGTNESVIKNETKPKKFRCTKCSEVFPDADSHWLHYKVHVTESIHEVVHTEDASEPLTSPSYKCRTCAQEFPLRISLWWHYKSHLSDVEAEDTCVASTTAVGLPLLNTFRCQECPEEFSDEDLHWQHYKIHVSDACEEVGQEAAPEIQSEASFQCKKCFKTFMDERSHWVHYKVHADLPALEMYEIVKPANGQREGTPGQYRCSRCLELFADLEGHWWHFRTHYDPDELARLEVPVEDGVGEDVGGLTAPSRPMYKCSQCPEVFDDDRSRWWHYRVHAADSSTCFEMVRSRPEYRCVKCSQVFPDVANHWLHFRTHYEEEPEVVDLDAPVNGKATPSPAGKQYRCSKCPELFENPEAHWKHYRQHYESVCREVSVDQDAGEKMTEYRCRKCDQVSDNLEAHWWHYRSHMDVGEDEELEQAAGTVAFRCVECAETFPDADSHWSHYRQHVEEAEVCEEVAPPDVKPKVYPCSKCPEVFPDRRSRFLHCAVHVTPRGSNAAGPSAPVLIDKDKGLQCNACREIFLDAESHWWHYKTVHNADAEQVGPETYQIVELTNDPMEDPMTKRCQCSKCPETFPNRKAHHRHYKAVHAMEGVARSPLMVGSFPCSRCPKVFADRKSHWWHYRTHTDVPSTAAVELAVESNRTDEHDNPAKEDAGDAAAAAEEVASAHTETAAPAPKEYRCSRCPEVFPDLEQHWWHYRVHSDEEFVSSVKGLEEQMHPAEATTGSGSGRYQCSKCQESFPDRKAHWAHYKMHKPRSTSTGRYVATPPPGKVSSGTKTEGDQHVKSTEKHKCNVCSKVFQLWINLFNHKKSHDLVQGEAAAARPAAEESPAQSTTSARKFLCSPSVVVGRSFKCSHCPARLSNRRLLWAHFKTHKQGNRSYTCGECDAKFNSRGALRAHVAVHVAPAEAGLVPLLASIPEEQGDTESRGGFPCSKCDAVFKNKVALGSHQRVHPAPKPFKCKTCGARFSYEHNMMRHVRRTHQKSKK